MTAAADGAPATILFVCTGNICRSPLAERLTAAHLALRLGPDAAGITVRSAGTYGLEGSGMEDFARVVLGELGVDAGNFRARRLVPEHVAGAEVVLTMTREHRAAAVRMDARAAARCFTLRQFARLAAGVDAATLPAPGTGPPGVARLRALVGAAAARRGADPPGPPLDDDVPDPYGAPLPVFRTCARLIADALVPTLELIAVPVGR